MTIPCSDFIFKTSHPEGNISGASGKYLNDKNSLTNSNLMNFILILLGISEYLLEK